MNKKILFLILLGVLILPSLASADISIQGMVEGAVNTTWIIAAGVVVILWVVTGLLFLLAQGSPEKVNSAKKSLLAAIAGTVLVIVAFSAISLVSDAFNLGT
jgi:uncharacterized membrane protein (DUF485 family)